jgi:cardiolipin synthase
MAAPRLKLKWRSGNDIRLLHNGGEYFPALIRAIDAARQSVHLETYIFNLDDTGNRVIEALKRAVDRGVKVRVVLDGFGCNENAYDVCDRLTDCGVRHRVYRPEPKGLRQVAFNLRRLRRMHRKTCVIDGDVGFVGGINVLDDLEDVPNDGKGPRPRFDFAVEMRGPIVEDLMHAQRGLWLRMSWRRTEDAIGFYKRFQQWGERLLARRHARRTPAEGGMKAALLLRDNFRYRQRIEDVYVAAIARAQHDVLIANAYFFPGRRLRKALRAAAVRGVKVRLLLQGRAEYAMQYRACRYMYNELLAEGMEIHEYMASYLHAKVAVVDDFAMVGSSNLDPFSLLLAREANVFIDDGHFANSLKGSLEAEMANDARVVTVEHLGKRNVLERVLDVFSYAMLRFGVALTGKSAQY